MELLRDQLERAGLHAKLPDGYQWGEDALEQFEAGKRRATEAILAALDKMREANNT